MAKFRKKPVVIEAVTWYGKYSKPTDWPHWFSDAIRADTMRIDPTTSQLLIQTLEGLMTASIGDQIIQGVKGEIYPCKPDIFEATYEPE